MIKKTEIYVLYPRILLKFFNLPRSLLANENHPVFRFAYKKELSKALSSLDCQVMDIEKSSQDFNPFAQRDAFNLRGEKNRVRI